MSDSRMVALTLEQESDYAFRVSFDGTSIGDLHTDEPPPLGKDAGPDPARLLLAAVANCLCASLLFALRKFRDEPGQITAHARATLERNAGGRWRVARISVEIDLPDAADALPHLQRAIAQFEDFCIVTESVRAGIAVDVRVLDGGGRQVGPTAPA